MSENIKILGRRFFEAQDRLKGGPDVHLCHADYIAQIMGNPPLDRAGHELLARHFYQAFPDLKHHFEHVLADGDNVSVWITLRGTHTGPFMGIPATGRSISVSMSALLHVKEGKVARLQGMFDQPGMMQQLGIAR
jgi:steroid delta-isomerase-like uncharacterized protein